MGGNRKGEGQSESVGGSHGRIVIEKEIDFEGIVFANPNQLEDATRCSKVFDNVHLLPPTIIATKTTYL